MADAVLIHLTANNVFDLHGVVAVVTGGGTVRILSRSSHFNYLISSPHPTSLSLPPSDYVRAHGGYPRCAESLEYWVVVRVLG